MCRHVQFTNPKPFAPSLNRPILIRLTCLQVSPCTVFPTATGDHTYACIRCTCTPSRDDTHTHQTSVYNFLHVSVRHNTVVFWQAATGKQDDTHTGITHHTYLSSTLLMYLSSVLEQAATGEQRWHPHRQLHPSHLPVYNFLHVFVEHNSIVFWQTATGKQDDTHTDITHLTYLSTTFSMYLSSTTALSFGT